MRLMVHILVKKGLDIPIAGAPSDEEVRELPMPKFAALDLSLHEGVRFTMHAKIGDEVLSGQPLVEDKACSGRVFLAPAAGRIVDVIRGLKRRILYVVIETGEQKFFKHAAPIYSGITCRPCGHCIDSKPKAIFVKGLESAPFTPPPELEVRGYEKEFAEGLKNLSKLAPVHLVHRKGSIFQSADVNCHTAFGPHPVANPSVHIAAIDPIRSIEDRVWVASVRDVIGIGHMVLRNTAYTSRIISIAGESIPEKHRGYFRIQDGYPIGELIKDRCLAEGVRFIAGDPLTGRRVSHDDFLSAPVLCAIPEGGPQRELFHFLRFFKYSATRAYLGKKRAFTTNQHGEERAFVDGSIYDKVMPLKISTMHLAKAILAEEYERAIELGLLEVAPEDFALPAYICPSKIDLVHIARSGALALQDL